LRERERKRERERERREREDERERESLVWSQSNRETNKLLEINIT
jgi:hypothetical protein